MRILMLNNEYPPLGGGTGTVNEAILRQFSKRHDLDIDLVTSAGGSKFEQGLLFDRFRIFRIPVNRFHIHHASNGELIRYAWRAFWFAYRLHREKPYDLCMAWSTVPAGGTALALRVSVGLPYLVRVTGPDIPGFEARYDRVTAVLMPLIRRIWRGARKVIAKCREEVDMIQAVEPQLPVEIIPNGVDVERFRTERPLYEGLLRILCVGRLIERKGQADLIKAVSRLKAQGIQVRCRFVGTGDSEVTYRKLAEELGVKNDLEFAGYIPREEMPEVYSNADLFVLPSYAEGMSVAALEARAAGLALVLSRAAAAGDIVIEGKNGWIFREGDLNSLIEILTTCSIDRTLLTQFGAESQKMAKSETWHLIASIYEAQLFPASVA